MAAEFSEGMYSVAGERGDDNAIATLFARSPGVPAGGAAAAGEREAPHPADSLGGFHESDLGGADFGAGLADEPSPHASLFAAGGESLAPEADLTTPEMHRDFLNLELDAQEKVIGNDDRGFVSQANVRRFPYSAVCLVRARFADGWYTGTGVLATPNMVVTAAHNLLRSRRPSQVELHFGVFQGQAMARRTANRLEIHPRFRSSVDPPEVDYGAVFFSSPLSEIPYVRFVPIKDRQTYLQIRARVEVPGFPKINRSAGVMYTSRDRIVDVLTSGRIVHQVDTTEGQSGAPIIAWFPKSGGQPRPGVVGIHNQFPRDATPVNYGAFVNDEMIRRLLAWKNAA